MTLGGLAVAIGMVVDDAIVDVENVFRRLRENAALANPHPRLTVIAKASGEVRNSILYATILIILVFLPLLGLTGVEGKLFAPIAIATIISMIASFIVSLTVIPGALLVPAQSEGRPRTQGRPFVTRGMKWLLENTLLRFGLSQPYAGARARADHRRRRVLALSEDEQGLPAQVPGGDRARRRHRRARHLAGGNEPDFRCRSSSRFYPCRRSARSAAASAAPSAATMSSPFPPSSSTWISRSEATETGRSRKEILDDISAKVKTVPGVFGVVSGPLADRIGHMLSGVSAPVAVKIFGPDLDEAAGNRNRDPERRQDHPRLRGCQARPTVLHSPAPHRGGPRPRPGLRHRSRPAQRTTLRAHRRQGSRRAARWPAFDESRHPPAAGMAGFTGENRRSFPSRLGNGQHIPLSLVADVREAKGPNVIFRENSQRRFAVAIKPTVRDVSNLVVTLAGRGRGKGETARRLLHHVRGRVPGTEGSHPAHRDLHRRSFCW